MAMLVRVVNQQQLNRSILIDKVDRTSGQFETGIPYAQVAKQKVYVPYSNPLDSSVKGYIDMVPTDEVLLQLNDDGVLAGLVAQGYITTTLFNSSLIVAPTIASAVHTTIGPVLGQTGAAASIGLAAAGESTITGLTGMTAGSVNNLLTISGAATGANNGTFRITAYISAVSVRIANASAVVDANNTFISWSEFLDGYTTITGTNYLSLTPDVTYLTLKNLSNVTQTISDAQIIAAGAPSSIGATIIKVTDSLVTIGTPAVGWKAKVQANSQLTAEFTL